MLSDVLNSGIAINVNISIMRAFVPIRQGFPQVNNNKKLEKINEETMTSINDLSEDTRKELDNIYVALSQLVSKQKQSIQSHPAIGYKAIQKKKATKR